MVKKQSKSNISSHSLKEFPKTRQIADEKIRQNFRLVWWHSTESLHHWCQFNQIYLRQGLWPFHQPKSLFKIYSLSKLNFFTIIWFLDIWKNFKVSRKVIRKMISIMENQEWKDVRSSITPTFTTGKIKKVCWNFYNWLNRVVFRNMNVL